MLKRVKEYVVRFRLPGDGLFAWHGTNCREVSAAAAMARVQACLPEAKVTGAEEGMICLYGKKWADYDSANGAEAAPRDPAANRREWRAMIAGGNRAAAKRERERKKRARAAGKGRAQC